MDMKKKDIEGQFAAMLERLQKLEDENLELRETVTHLNQRVDREIAQDTRQEQETVSLLADMEEQGQWREISDLLALQASKCVSRKIKCQILLRQALVLAENLNDLDEAVSVLYQAALTDPSNRSVVDALYNVHQRTGKWASLVQLLKEIGNSPSAGSNLNALLCYARVLDQHLEEPEEAQNACKAILEVDPDNEEARQLLDSLILR